MKFEYYPEEIAVEIAHKAGEDGENILSECVEALEYLKALCENEYNRDCFRALYRVLGNLSMELRHDREMGKWKSAMPKSIIY